MSPGPWVDSQVGAANERPGLYANFQAEATALISGGLSGVVAVAGQSAWGPDEVVQEILNETELDNYYTKDETSPFDLPFMISQILKGGAKSCLAYRLEGTTAAKSTLSIVDTTGAPVNTIDIKGKYNGARGNAFTITIAANAIDGTKKDVTLKEGATTLVVWTTTISNGGAGMMQTLVDQINDDDTNYWVTATFIAAGNETLANISATNLATGANGNAPAAADWDAAMDAFEIEDFAIFVGDTQDGTILGNIETWVKTDLRATGKKVLWITGSESADTVTAAIADAAGLDHEGIVYVYPGFKYLDFLGVQQTARGSKAAARVAGIIAGLSLAATPTFQQISDIVDIETRLTNAQVKTALAGGVLPLVWDGGKFKIERGINTLTTLATTQNSDFKKIKIIRIIDSIENALSVSVADNIVGKFLNNSNGQNAVLALIIDYLASLSRQGIIENNFTAVLDPQNPSTSDRMFVLISMKPIDSIEYVYTTIEISA